MSEVVDWQRLFFDPDTAVAEKLARLARRRFGDSADAESAYNFALDTISANDWQRLREGYASRGSPLGFMKTAFVRLLEDYATSKYGRKRPPVWLQRLGPLWKRIYEFLCLKRLPPETIVDQLCAHGDERPETVRVAIAQIKGRVPGCGQYIGEYTADDVASSALEQHDRVEPLERMERAEITSLLTVLSELLQGAAAASADVDLGQAAAGLDQGLGTVREALAIEAHERLLLRLVYQQGASIAAAARALHVPEHTIRRQHKALMARIHTVLQRHGLDADSLRLAGRAADSA